MNSVMRWVCYIAPAIYLALCVASVAVLFISTEPLVGLYALFLAWPWSFVVLDTVNSSSMVVNIALVAAAFALNAAILYGVSRLLMSLLRRRS